MFVSFFPQPKLFFISAVVWSLAVVLFWFFGGEQLGAVCRPAAGAADAPPIIGIAGLLVEAVPLVLLYFALRRRPSSTRSGAGIPPSLAELVDPRLGADPVHRPIFRCRSASRSTTGTARSAIYSRAPVDAGCRRPTGELYSHGLAASPGSALIGMGCSVLNRFFVSHYDLPLAHRDERLLHGELAQAASHRRRLAARAGRHDAVLHDHGGPRRVT